LPRSAVAAWCGQTRTSISNSRATLRVAQVCKIAKSLESQESQKGKIAKPQSGKSQER